MTYILDESDILDDLKIINKNKAFSVSWGAFFNPKEDSLVVGDLSPPVKLIAGYTKYGQFLPSGPNERSGTVRNGQTNGTVPSQK